MELFSLVRGRGRRAAVAGFAATTSAMMLASVAGATPLVLTRGHAYCFYFSTPTNGGMHLVAAGPRAIAAGPSNYISGENGRPQDTVVFVGCVDAAGNQDGSAYMGLPRIALKDTNGHLHFAEHAVVHNVRRLDSAVPGKITVDVTVSGTYLAADASTRAIVGRLVVDAPGCLAKPLVLPFTGT